MLCARAKGADACSGDSGGPFTVPDPADAVLVACAIACSAKPVPKTTANIAENAKIPPKMVK